MNIRRELKIGISDMLDMASFSSASGEILPHLFA